MEIKDIKPGDVFSELTYYTAVKVENDKVHFKLQSGEEVVFKADYVKKMLVTANQFEKVVNVGKEDTFWTQKQIDEELKKNPKSTLRVGDLKQKGIRTIWNEIGSDVFSVEFTKQNAVNKNYDAEVTAKIEEVKKQIETAKKNKKNVTDVSIKLMEDLIKNPIQKEISGERRILVGYKLEHESLTGYYRVIDATIQEERKVNLSTVSWIVHRGVKYVVK